MDETCSLFIWVSRSVPMLGPQSVAVESNQEVYKV